MVGTRNSPGEVSSYLRKIRKPLIEKKRRERMNDSILQLKSLIADTIRNNIAPMTRVEKADILELTVTHLTQLQHQQRSITMATEAAAYNAGFKDCTGTTLSFLSAGNLVDGKSICHLGNHLYSTLQGTSRTKRPSVYNNRGMQTLSMPIRVQDANNAFKPTQIPDFSPIQYGGQIQPEVALFCLDGRYNMAPMIGNLRNSSLNSVSDNSMNSSSDHSMRSVDTSDSDENIDGVSIGEGKEDAVGHVIRDNMWRPW